MTQDYPQTASIQRHSSSGKASMKNVNSQATGYRRELDGLRAVAVVAVIINHFDSEILPSGYLGVDIFFVISGYVISSSIANRSESRSFCEFITSFYSRRLKRLIPALVAFVLLTSLITSFFTTEAAKSIALGWKALIGVSNISLYLSSTDYFAQSTDLNAFTNTWSLGVEEQFYLVFPIILWLTGFVNKNKYSPVYLGFSMGVLSIASLAMYVHLYNHNFPAAYFLMPSRFWEMATGSLTFLFVSSRSSILKRIQSIPTLPVFLIILGSTFLPESQGKIATIIVVMMTALLISCIKKNDRTYQYLVHKILVHIGLISYSLYLWHWSILVISRWTTGIHWWTIPIQLILIYVVSYCSYRYIEKPFRNRRWFEREILTVLSGFAISFGTGITMRSLISTDLGNRLISSLYVGRGDILKEELEIYSSKCLRNVKGCLIYRDDPKKQQVAIIGDSHAGSLEPYIKSHDIGRTLHYSSGGPGHQPFPLVHFTRRNGTPASKILQVRNDYMTIVDNILTTFSRGDRVLIASSLPRYFSSKYNGDFVYWNDSGQNITYSKAAEEWLRGLQIFAQQLAKREITLIVLLPPPRFNGFLNPESCSTEWFRPTLPAGCYANLSMTEMIDDDWLKLVNKVKRLSYKIDNLKFIDSLEVFCKNSICTNLSKDYKPLYIDDNHLSSHGVMKLAHLLDEKLID